MTHKETEELIDKFLDGETSLKEENRLALEVIRNDAPREWKIIAVMMGERAIDEAQFDYIMAERNRSLEGQDMTQKLVTHSRHDAGYADRIVNLFDGQVVEEMHFKGELLPDNSKGRILKDEPHKEKANPTNVKRK